MTPTPLTRAQKKQATDELAAAAKLYDRYLQVSGINDVAAFHNDAPYTFLAPRPVPLTLTFTRR